jgi:hypothetical protein
MCSETTFEDHMVGIDFWTEGVGLLAICSFGIIGTSVLKLTPEPQNFSSWSRNRIKMYEFSNFYTI